MVTHKGHNPVGEIWLNRHREFWQIYEIRRIENEERCNITCLMGHRQGENYTGYLYEIFHENPNWHRWMPDLFDEQLYLGVGGGSE